MLNIFKPRVAPNFELIELENVCRVCLRCTTNMLSLFNNQIDSLISEFLPQKLYRKRLQPHLICSKCFEDATNAYIFKKQCLYSDELIKSMLNEPNIKIYFEKQTQTDISDFRYPCEKCEKKFETSEILREHRLNEHHKSSNACRKCDKIFTTIGTLRNHLVAAHPEPSFTSNNKCHLCKKTFIHRHYLKEHLLNVHAINESFVTTKDVNETVNEDSFVFVKTDECALSCGICFENFELEDDLKNHECTTFPYEEVLEENSLNGLQLKNTHDKIEIEVVPVSELKNMCYSVFDDNLKTNDEKENTVEKYGDEIFVSEIEIKNEKFYADEFKVSQEILDGVNCWTESKEKINKKLKTNANPKLFDCTLCSQSYTKSINLKRHVDSIHNGLRPFQCTTCKRSFKQKVHLLSHYNRQTCSTEKKERRKREKNIVEKYEGEIFGSEIEIKNEKLDAKEFKVSQEVLAGENCSTASKGKITRKVNTNANLKRFDCTLCSQSFTTSANLKRHVNSIHTGLRPFQCTTCKRSFKQKVHLLSHYNRQTCSTEKKERQKREKLFSCNLCIKKFTSQRSVRSHIAVIHNETPVKQYLCSECGVSFIRLEHFSVHMRRHRGEKPHKCRYCDRAFLTTSGKNDHERIHTGEKNYHCTVCSKAFSRSNRLQVHMRIHTGERPYKCSYCPKACIDSGSLKKHHRTHTGERSYCDLCSLSYSLLENLSKHKLEVHGITGIDKTKTFTCRYCSEKIIGAIEYKNHCTVHHTRTSLANFTTPLVPHHNHISLEKPHICSVCGASFKRSEVLKIHKRRHNGEKPYKCQSCDKAFVTASDLDRHKKIHTGEKNHHCTKCPKTFFEAYTLRIHMRTHTGERPYKCSYCPMAFIENRSLKKHLGKHTVE